MTVSIALGALAFISLTITIWQWAVARAFPLHTRPPRKSFAPAVTVLKPLKGCEPSTAACLKSWLEQAYQGEIEVLFGVTSKSDPVCAVVRDLLAAYSKTRAKLIFCPKRLGPNGKVSTLIQLYPHARQEVIIVSDADVLVPHDLVANLVSPLEENDVGLVNCFYSLANATTLAMQWEAVAINSDFWSQVLQSRSMKPLDFSLGAVMSTRREEIERIGGFEALVEFLADDYQLGRRIAKQRKRIVLSETVAECWSREMGWREVWKHQLRWTRTIRVCKPVAFLFTILSNATFWPVLWGLLAATGWVWTTVGFCLLMRIATAFDSRSRLTRSFHHWRYAWIVFVKDILSLALWVAAFLGNTVEWRDERFFVLTDGKLVRSPDVQPCASLAHGSRTAR